MGADGKGSLVMDRVSGGIPRQAQLPSIDALAVRWDVHQVAVLIINEVPTRARVRKVR